MKILCHGDPIPNEGQFVYLCVGEYKRDAWFPTNAIAREGLMSGQLVLREQPLYAGSSFRLRDRIKRHVRTAPWFPGVYWIIYAPVGGSREAMLKVERDSIYIFQPAHNRTTHKPKGLPWTPLLAYGGHWAGSRIHVTARPEEDDCLLYGFTRTAV